MIKEVSCRTARPIYTPFGTMNRTPFEVTSIIFCQTDTKQIFRRQVKASQEQCFGTIFLLTAESERINVESS